MDMLRGRFNLSVRRSEIQTTLTRTPGEDAPQRPFSRVVSGIGGEALQHMPAELHPPPRLRNTVAFTQRSRWMLCDFLLRMLLGQYNLL